MAKRIYEKVAGEWKRVKKAWVKDTNDWKRIKKGWVKNNAQWKLFFAGGFPPGIILPFNSGGTVPVGWEEYTAPYGRLIMGADTKYPTTTAAGQNTYTYSAGVPTAGSHNGTAYAWNAYFNGDGDCAYCIKYDGDAQAGYTRGGHSHSAISGTASTKPTSTEIRLVKLVADSQDLPQRVCVLSHQDISSAIANPIELSADAAYNLRCMQSGSTPGIRDGGNVNSSASSWTSYAGNHHHGGVNRTLKLANSNYYAVYSGNHRHSGYVQADTTSYNVHYLSMWYSASSEIEANPNMIGMWEGTVAPEGWAICNGNNGTPDLRSKFIRFIDSSTTVPATPDTKHHVKFTMITDSAATHNHKTSTKNSHTTGTTLSVKHANSVGHTHATVTSDKDIEPEYYALTFIMRLAN